ncbi:MAG: orotate phosphoribosyltransferase [Rhizobiales bacterium]|nr:orotate phosphoribosyltransferase [Hyphomicrobiales bacterium]
MKQKEVLDIFRRSGAILEGHFILSSGLRSKVFLQKAKVFQYPAETEKLCRALAEKIRQAGLGNLDAVVSPAVGGIIPGYETARHLNLPALYVEREGGEFTLRRGFELAKGARVLVVEDIVSTGLSVRECIAALVASGVDVVAVACLIDRSAGEVDVGRPLIALTEFKVDAYPADNLPPELRAIEPVKPGSRGLK